MLESLFSPLVVKIIRFRLTPRLSILSEMEVIVV